MTSSEERYATATAFLYLLNTGARGTLTRGSYVTCLNWLVNLLAQLTPKYECCDLIETPLTHAPLAIIPPGLHHRYLLHGRKEKFLIPYATPYKLIAIEILCCWKTHIQVKCDHIKKYRMWTALESKEGGGYPCHRTSGSGWHSCYPTWTMFTEVKHNVFDSCVYSPVHSCMNVEVSRDKAKHIGNFSLGIP